MMHTDPPDHTRYRKLVQPGFAPSRMRALATRVRARADELVARVEPGEPFDAVEALAVPFPLWIIAELLGIPESDWHRFYQWSEASIPGATDWPPEECQRLQAEMHEYLLATTKARGRGDPRDDIISVLAHAEVDGESLSDDELVMFLNQLLVAGNETDAPRDLGRHRRARASGPSSGSASSTTARCSTPRPRRSCAGPRR